MAVSVTIYRGSHQIGGCATEIRCDDSRIIIDLGANLPGTKVEKVLGDEELIKTVFDDKKVKCEAVLFSHYHGDHYGLYKSVPEQIPMYMGRTAKEIVEIVTEKVDTISEEKGISKVRKFKPYIIGVWKNFGSIRVMPLVVDHSALDSYMFLIEAEGKRILFTGDFRDHGIASQNEVFDMMLREKVGKVDVLITEGTMVSRIDEAKTNPVQTEDDLGNEARRIFSEKHETVVLVSSTNLDSIMEFYHAVPWGKDFVCDAYQAKIMLKAMERKGKYYKKYRPAMIHGKPRRIYIVGDMDGLNEQNNCYKADFSILRKKGFVMLARPNRVPLRDKGRFELIVDKLDNPFIVYSMWKGYIEGEHTDAQIVKFIGDRPMKPLHTSGHAYVETIQKVMWMTDPGTIIPMHTERADEFKQVEEFLSYGDKIKVLVDGETYFI